jgi:putative tryptophan/tyrosine transport system substrate-binding protein
LFYGISVAEGGNAMIIKIIGLITTLVLTHIDLAAAQQPAKTPRIGFLFVGSKDQPHLESFHQGLRELGYVDGKNVLIEYRYAEGKSDALPALAADLVALNVEVIVTTNPNGSRAVLRASSAIPIVVVGFDPVATGLVKSLAHPGGNITGLSSRVGPDMEGKRLDVLKEAFPKISAVAMLWNPEAGQLAHLALDSAKRGAEALDIELRPHEVRNAGDIDRAFGDLKKLRPDALLIPGGVLMTLNSRRVVGLAAKHRLPAIYQTRQFVQDGGLMAYGVSFPDLYKRAAIYVDKILKGTKPADLPVELPMKFELFINLKAAKEIGVTIPPNVLARADKVIK